MLLVQLLLDRVRSLVETGEFGAVDGLFDEHRALGIDGRHYSRFGDALVPILRDVLGPGAPREIAGLWCDTFWSLIRELEPSREPVPA